jgi:hypothetical protein
MLRVDVTGIPISAASALRAGLLAWLLSAVGCSGPVSDNKTDNPAMKASMQKSMEIYKSKTASKKAPMASLKRQH